MGNKFILSTLSNPTRLRLICCLSKRDKNVHELINNCGLSQSAVSQHLAKLRASGLVTTRRNGQEIYYSLTSLKAAKVARSLLSFIK